MEVKIRRLSASDYSAVKTIEHRMLDEYREELEKRGERDAVQESIEPKYFKHYVSKEGSFVAEADGMLVGYILSKAASFLHGVEKSVWLEQIAVLGGFRKEGIGSMLLVSVEDWAKKRRMNLLYATLNPDNEASARLLRGRGFEVQDWRKATKALGN